MTEEKVRTPLTRQQGRLLLKRPPLTIDRIEVVPIEGGYRALVFVEGAALPSTYVEAADPDEAEARATLAAIRAGWVLP